MLRSIHVPMVNPAADYMPATEFCGPEIDIGDCQPLRMDGSSTVGALIPDAIRSNVQSDAITAPLVDVKTAHAGVAKSELLIQYIKGIPDSVPNSRKMSASLIWLFLRTIPVVTRR